MSTDNSSFPDKSATKQQSVKPRPQLPYNPVDKSSGTKERFFDNIDKTPGDPGGPGFIHLHTHSAYSLLEGAVQPKRLQELAIADGQPALAITDRNNLFGALEFSEKASGLGLQPIMGSKLSIDFADFANFDISSFSRLCILTIII